MSIYAIWSNKGGIHERGGGGVTPYCCPYVRKEQ